MQSEESVEVDATRRTARARRRVDRELRTRGVVVLVAERHDHVQCIGRTTLEQHDQRLAARPQLAINTPARTSGPAGCIDLDGFFGLHPSLSSFKPLWDRGLLAPIHAVGSPSSTRSHFDAQDYMESGTPDVKSTPDGWLNRYLATKGTCEECATHGGVRPSPFQAVAMTDQTPRILEGAAPAVAMSSLDAFTVLS